MEEAGLGVRAERFVLGPFATNCYVLFADAGERGKPAWIVDAGFGAEEMVERCGELGLAVEKMLLTHAHADHIAGLSAVREAFPGAEVLIHAAERGWLDDPEANLSAMGPPELGGPLRLGEPDGALDDGDELALGGVEFVVRHTPGHSPGGVVLYSASLGVVLAGDTLFRGSIGRSDFPTSDGAALERSIREVLYALPDATAVWPGHGEPTTIGEEKASNPFVRG